MKTTSKASKVEEYSISFDNARIIYEVVPEGLDNSRTSSIIIRKHENVIGRNSQTVDKIMPNGLRV